MVRHQYLASYLSAKHIDRRLGRRVGRCAVNLAKVDLHVDLILIAAAALISQANAKESCVRVVNQAVVSKLCPDPNARCLVRDNSNFYKESDPALYNRITKCKK